MKRRFQGLSSMSQADAEIPDGVYLVRVNQVRYMRERQKPFYSIRFAIVEPAALAGSVVAACLYCTHYKKDAPFEVGCGCCHEQSTTPTKGTPDEQCEVRWS